VRGPAEVKLTVSLPVSLSMPTWVMWVALEGAEMVGRRDVDGLLLKSENIFFLPSPFAPSDRRSCLVFPKPESIRAGVAAMVKDKERTRTQRFSTGLYRLRR